MCFHLPHVTPLMLHKREQLRSIFQIFILLNNLLWFAWSFSPQFTLQIIICKRILLMESPSKVQPPLHQELEGLVNVSREE